MEIITSKLHLLREKPIVFYDGTCGFCQGSVQFILKYNKNQNLYFVTLQSEVAQTLLQHSQAPDPLPDSMLFYERDVLYTESEAVLRVARYLSFPFSLFYYFRFIPLSFRNFVYRLVAKNRYLIAGRTESCMLPSLEERARFLA